jgi:hypothetical protein
VSGKQSPLGWSFRPYQTLYQPVPLTGIPTGEISTKGDCMYSDHQIFSEPNNHSSITIMREQVVLTLEIGDVAHSFVMDEHEVKELYCGMQRALSFIKKGDS